MRGHLRHGVGVDVDDRVEVVRDDARDLVKFLVVEGAVAHEGLQRDRREVAHRDLVTDQSRVRWSRDEAITAMRPPLPVSSLP